MTTKALAKAVTRPTASRVHSLVEKEKLDLMRSRPVAASMVGMARRKENSTMVSRLMPSVRPPMMVAPARETPGIMARHWKRPILKADWLLMFSILAVLLITSMT